MKLSKQELKEKVSNSITDNDELVLSLLEDIEDSINENTSETEELKTKYEELNQKYSDLMAKYKDRFLNKEEIKEKKEDGLEEEEVIDIKEI